MILLLVDPFLGRSIGFALSVLACAGIVWWARSWTVIMNRWLPLIIAESIAVPLAAQLGHHSGGSGRLRAGERRRSGGECTGGSIRRPFDSAGICRRRHIIAERDLGGRLRLRCGMERASDHLDRHDRFATSRRRSGTCR